MTEVSYELPEIGEVSLAADPRTLNALIALKAWINGEAVIDETKLDAALISKINAKATGLESQKKIIAAEETREQPAFGKLTTPDEVTVTLAENGLLAVAYQARWKESVQGAARAAIFLGGNQLTIDLSNTPTNQETMLGEGTGTVNVYRTLASCWEGLRSTSNAGPGAEDVTTGQVVGQSGFGGACLIFAAAGTYKVSVQFKASSGKVSAKQRKLWAWTIS
jgi:hypothetical protein